MNRGSDVLRGDQTNRFGVDRRRTLWSPRWIGLAVLAVIATCSFWLPVSAQSSKGKFVRNPYLQMATPDSIVVAWRSPGKIDPVVRFGESAKSLTEESKAENIVERV